MIRHMINIKTSETDYLIIGQGLAGSIIAYKLALLGHKVCIIDNKRIGSSSNIGHGIISPITGTRFAKSWSELSIQDNAISFYSELEKTFNTSIISSKPMIRFIYNDFEYKQYHSKSSKPEFNSYFKRPFTKDSQNIHVNHNFGGFHLNTYSVSISTLLTQLKQFLIKTTDYREALFDHSILKDSIKSISADTPVSYKDIKARRVIFCEGYQITNNPFFNTLPYRHVKGEVLDIYCETLDETTIYSNGKWLLPIGNNKFVFGATYDRHDMTHEATEHGKKRLTRLLSEFLKHPFTITGHRVGIRPSTTDFRPIIGRHPNFDRLFVFNGFGSKGLSLIPELAHQFSLFLNERKPLDANISLSRYNHLI